MQKNAVSCRCADKKWISSRGSMLREERREIPRNELVHDIFLTFSVIEMCIAVLKFMQRSSKATRPKTGNKPGGLYIFFARVQYFVEKRNHGVRNERWRCEGRTADRLTAQPTTPLSGEGGGHRWRRVLRVFSFVFFLNFIATFYRLETEYGLGKWRRTAIEF